MNRCIACILALLGVASLVFGIIFIIQSNSGKQVVADEINPLVLSELNAKYDAVKAGQQAYAATEEPLIQTGQAPPSVMYDYLSAQRGLLGLAKADIALAGFVQMSGIVDIVIGVGLILAGLGLLKQSKSPAKTTAA
ncbi:MAG: hypothetical protein NTX46_06160 [Chloroflexi bacterium]|nr:hypothetical protein [Chloroflexota bacterium]